MLKGWQELQWQSWKSVHWQPININSNYHSQSTFEIGFYLAKYALSALKGKSYYVLWWISVLPTDQDHFEKQRLSRGAEEKTRASALDVIFPVETQLSPSMHTNLCIFSYIKSSYIKKQCNSDVLLLFKLIYFLMVYLHSRICILFHSKSYDATCPILGRTPELRKKIDMLKKRMNIWNISPTHSYLATLNFTVRTEHDKAWWFLPSHTGALAVSILLPSPSPLPLLLQFKKGNFPGDAKHTKFIVRVYSVWEM